MLQTVNNFYIINLKHEIARYNHCVYELAKAGFKNLNFVNGILYDEEVVKNYYKKNLVKGFDSCFRCDDIMYLQDECIHLNNIITPPQVANFLSFNKVMNIAVKNEGLTAVFEDDIFFKKNFNYSLINIDNFITKNNLQNSTEPVLIRFGSHTIFERRYEMFFKIFKKNIFLKNKFNMSNPGFIFNKQFAEIFIKEFNYINTTSDNFIHKLICMKYKVKNYSVVPFPVSQFTHKSKKEKFKSSIDKDFSKDSNFYFKNFVNSKKEYEELLKLWVN